MINNKGLHPVVTEIFIRGRKLKIYLAFITQSYFRAPKNVRLTITLVFLRKIPNRQELQQSAINNSSDIDFEGFMRLYRKYTAKPCSILFVDTTLPSNNASPVRKNILEEVKRALIMIDEKCRSFRNLKI